VFILFTGVKGRSPEYEKPQDLRSNPFQGGRDDAILPPRVLDRRLQEDWAKTAKEGPGVLMNLRVDILSPWAKVGSTLLCKY